MLTLGVKRRPSRLCIVALASSIRPVLVLVHEKRGLEPRSLVCAISDQCDWQCEDVYTIQRERKRRMERWELHHARVKRVGGVTGEGRGEFIVKSAKSAVGGSPLLLSPVLGL